LAEVSSFVEKLHENGQHFVPIIDPGIMVLEGKYLFVTVSFFYKIIQDTMPTRKD
jgi:hypothetical protein